MVSEIREYRTKTAALLAEQLGLPGDALYAAALAAWSNLSPQLVSFDRALSVAAAALKAAAQVSAEDEPVYTVRRGDIARLAGREITDEESARIAKAISYSTAQEAIGEAVFQVCGYPPDEDDEEEL